MAQVSFMDSSGLGAVVFILKHLGHKGRLHICGVTPGVMAVLKLTRMDRVLKTFETRQAAIAA
jgi:anti-sigma B factor antagonist